MGKSIEYEIIEALNVLGVTHKHGYDQIIAEQQGKKLHSHKKSF